MDQRVVHEMSSRAWIWTIPTPECIKKSALNKVGPRFKDEVYERAAWAVELFIADKAKEQALREHAAGDVLEMVERRRLNAIKTAYDYMENSLVHLLKVAENHVSYGNLYLTKGLLQRMGLYEEEKLLGRFADKSSKARALVAMEDADNLMKPLLREFERKQPKLREKPPAFLDHVMNANPEIGYFELD